jgi:phosphatidate cytidylyltransferase
LNELITRIVSGIALAAILLGDLWLGSGWYAALLMVGLIVVLREFTRLVYRMTSDTTKRIAWLMFGAVYLAAAGLGLWNVRAVPGDGFFLAMWLFVIVWAVDTGAFIAGRTFGGPKIAPSISPSKTWSGLMGGMAGAAMFSFVMAMQSNRDPIYFALLSLPIAIIAQIGDFLESWMKRRAGVKDSGSLIPGHGGLFDRVDGLLPVAIIFPWWMGLAV